MCIHADKCTTMEQLREDVEETEKKGGRMMIEDQDFRAEFKGKSGR